MGDRESPVDGVPSLPTSAHGIALAHHAERNEFLDKEQIWGRAERKLMLDEQRFMLQMAINQPDLRDEIYALLMKQLNQNPGALVWGSCSNPGCQTDIQCDLS